MMWPKDIVSWDVEGVRYLSIPFTWLLKKAENAINRSTQPVIVGGPAVLLMTGYFKNYNNVAEGKEYIGVLQKVNSWATRTTIGCPRKCGFCGVSKIEPEFKELQDWPDNPILCDNNILAASLSHFDRVCDRLEKWHWCDFNQGIDARLITSYHAGRFKRIGAPILRLALDHKNLREEWQTGYEILRSSGIQKRLIRSYVLIGWKDNPETAWENCRFIDAFKIKPLPMWFHNLDAMGHNIVTEEQKTNGWSDYERRKIMQWFYKHKVAVG